MRKIILAVFLCLLMLCVSAAADELSIGDVNAFLNSTAKLGEGSKANQVAVIPFSHIDGPQEEDLFYAFVPFKYVARSYIKYQVTFISCTCRSADVNVWSTAYVELTLPSSGKIEDAAVRTLSFDADSTGHYLGGFWGDSNPPPTAPNATYEKVKAEMIPYYIGKTYGQLMGLGTIADITDYSEGEGRENLSIDAWTGATVSSNNILRILQALYAYHATDSFFDGDPTSASMREVFEAKKETVAAAAAAAVAAGEVELPAPVDTTKTYLANKDDKEETICEPGNFGPTCSAINSENLKQYLGRTDVKYIDLRDYTDYAKKHLRNFEVIPYFALIYAKEPSDDMVQLYSGDLTNPTATYEESDQLLEAFFPKDQTIFLMCQSGGRVAQMMTILEAKGYDMSKIYNITGMGNYTDPMYASITEDTAEVAVEATYSFEGLTRVK